MMGTHLSFILIFLLLGIAIRATTGVDLHSIDREELMRMTAEAGHSYVDRLAQLEEDLIAQGVYVKEGSHMHRMAQFKRPSKEALELARSNLRHIGSARFLNAKLGSNAERFLDLLDDRALLVNGSCIKPASCTKSKYRNIDGSCNSLSITNLGRSLTPYRRLLSPAYSDGVELPRLTVSGGPLPSPRLVSTTVIEDRDNPIQFLTLSLMQWGQFINHDLEATNQFTMDDRDIQCCDENTAALLDPSQLSPFCMAIEVPEDDPFFNSPPPDGVVRTCMNFVRSLAGPSIDCSSIPPYADQLNSATHWHDGSTVYGSTDAKAKALRQFVGGLLQVGAWNGRDLLPFNECTFDPDSVTNPRSSCAFDAGDARVNEQPGLTLMHTLWVREHNRVARALGRLNPGWSDEILYQEARRVVIAEMQHITYREFLPNLLSNAVITSNGLAPLSTGFVTTYATNVPKGPVTNEFATAAFRMGHSLVQGKILLFDELGNIQGSLRLSDLFNNPSIMGADPTFLDSAIRGLANEPVQAVDKSVTSSMWLDLFKNSAGYNGGGSNNHGRGFDIVALNIQRGRDHGLPGYNMYRKLCGFQPVRRFEELFDPRLVPEGQPMMTKDQVGRLAQVYASVDDIDLYVGGLSEIPPTPTAPGTGVGILGPTFSCIIAENMKQNKFTDRFFYERGGQAHSFTTAQLAQIRNASLARIYCDNNDGTIRMMQARAFNVPDPATNPKVDCSSLPVVDLSFWRASS